MAQPIDLSNFSVSKFYNADVERDYINAILHAIVARITAFEKNSGIADAPSDGNLYGRKNGTWTIVSGGGSGSAGVISLNALTGALTLTSTGGTVVITPSGSTINLEAAGGGGAGITIYKSFVATAETTTSATFVPLTTPDSITFVLATDAFVSISGSLQAWCPPAAAGWGVFIDGVQAICVNNSNFISSTGASSPALQRTSTVNSGWEPASATFYQGDQQFYLAAGSHTIEYLYRTQGGAGTSNYQNRLLLLKVIPT